jgi:dipeptidyl aminopeptidase/acylaminoacyl peptidase
VLSGNRHEGVSVYLALVGLLISSPLSAQLMKEQPGPGLDSTALAIPLVAQTTRRPVTSLDLLTLRDLHGVSISPDAKQIAFVVGQAVLATNNYRTGLFVVGTDPGSLPVSLGNAGPPFWTLAGQWLPSAPQWSPDARYIAYRLKKTGTWQVWRWGRQGGEPVQITHCPYDVQTFRWSPDGTKIVFEVYEPRDPEEARHLADSGVLFADDIERPWDINTPIVEAKLDMSAPPPRTWIHDLETSKERHATPEEQEKLSIYLPSFKVYSDGTGDGVWSPDHTRLVFASTTSCGVHKCFPLSIKSGADGPARILTPGVYYASNPHWSTDGRQILFERHDFYGRVTLAAVPADGGPVRSLLATSGSFSLQDCSWDSTSTHAACVRQDPVTPPQVAFVDLRTGAARVVTDVNPEWKNLRLSPAAPIDWANDDYMHGHLVKPLDYQPGKRYPLVVTTYRDGASFLRGGVGDEYPIQVFAANGFAVLNFDVGIARESAPGDFKAAMSVWRVPLAGLRSAIQVLDRMGIIDPRRVGITGLSHGAEIAAFSISHSKLFRAAAMSQGGSHDLMGEYLQPTPWWREWFRTIGLVDRHGPILENWRELSASLNVARIRTPILLNESDGEYLYFMEFYSTLRDHHKPVELWIYPHEDHVKNQPKHRLAIYQRNLDWMKFWLQETEDLDPAKAEQYARWRELRKLQRQRTVGDAGVAQRGSE